MILWESFVGGGQSLGLVSEYTMRALVRRGWHVYCRPWNMSRSMRRALFRTEELAVSAGYSWGAEALAALCPELKELVASSERGLSCIEERTSLSITFGAPIHLLNPYYRYAGARVGFVYQDLSTISASLRQVTWTGVPVSRVRSSTMMPIFMNAHSTCA